MSQVSLVSMYGEKPEEFLRLIQRCTDVVQASPLQKVFSPYRPSQIHGTLVGMEKLSGQSQPFNRNEWVKSGGSRKVLMDFTPFLGLVRHHFPMVFRFGGFENTHNEFDSFGRTPYERSFQVQWTSNRITIIGWPHRNEDFTSRRLLQEFRDAAASDCHIRHKYENDNDWFIVLGEIAGMASFTQEEATAFREESTRVEETVRNILAEVTTDITVRADDVFVVQYQKETLPLESTVAYSVADPAFDESVIRSLYEVSEPSESGL